MMGPGKWDTSYGRTAITDKNVLPTCLRTSIRKADIYHFRKIIVVATTMPPKHYHDMLHRADRQELLDPYQREITSIEEVGKMTVVDRPLDKPVIPIQEIFAIKWDKTLTCFRVKCRIVARGDPQPLHVNYYPPVASVVGFRIFLLHALNFRSKIQQLDVVLFSLFRGQYF